MERLSQFHSHYHRTYYTRVEYYIRWCISTYFIPICRFQSGNQHTNPPDIASSSNTRMIKKNIQNNDNFKINGLTREKTTTWINNNTNDRSRTNRCSNVWTMWKVFMDRVKLTHSGVLLLLLFSSISILSSASLHHTYTHFFQFRFYLIFGLDVNVHACHRCTWMSY